MTLIELRVLCANAIGSRPHADVGATLANLRYLGESEREYAASLYRDIIHERELPANHGLISARQAIENRRDV